MSAVVPPSMTRVWPTIKPASSEHKKTASLAFGADPLAVGSLKIPGTHIIHAGIPCDITKRVLGRHVTAFAPDDYGEFRFIVGFFSIRRKHYRLSGSIIALVRLARRPAVWVEACCSLLGMILVVKTDTDYCPWCERQCYLNLFFRDEKLGL
jgi:hypothetical protein